MSAAREKHLNVRVASERSFLAAATRRGVRSRGKSSGKEKGLLEALAVLLEPLLRRRKGGPRARARRGTGRTGEEEENQ